jgi:hypothetical protein
MALFFMFVQSHEVKEILGSVYVEAIIKFAQENVLPQEERMVYFKRYDLFHLETHTNCGHEGTNTGMKNCCAPVMPQNQMQRSKRQTPASKYAKNEIPRNHGRILPHPIMLQTHVKACQHRLSGVTHQIGFPIEFNGTCGC